jgi:maleylacetoacetate isomerase
MFQDKIKMSSPKLHLHTYYRSSCSARVRTAAHLKNIPLTYTYIHLLQHQQTSAEYTHTNPSATVPTLTVTEADGTEIIIRQSVAILEFLEEYFPDTTPLLPPPSDVIGRARVRELVNIISNDIQPPTNLRILNRVKALGGDEAVWAKEIMTAGLQAYDKVAEKYAGRYSVGDEISMADVVLAPAVEGAVRFGVRVEGLGTVWRVYERVRGEEGFRRGDWRGQGDTPEEFRA